MFTSIIFYIALNSPSNNLKNFSPISPLAQVNEAVLTLLPGAEPEEVEKQVGCGLR